MAGIQDALHRMGRLRELRKGGRQHGAALRVRDEAQGGLTHDPEHPLGPHEEPDEIG